VSRGEVRQRARVICGIWVKFVPGIYDGVPREQSESVPICSTVLDVHPSIPIQNEAYSADDLAPQVLAGTTHDPETEVTDPAAPVTA